MKTLTSLTIGLAAFAGIAAAQSAQVNCSPAYPYPIFLVQNDTTTGTTLYKTADQPAGVAIVSPHGTSSGLVGVVVGNAGISGSACIAATGVTPLVMDGTATVGHCVVRSTTVDGDGHDTAAACTTAFSSGEGIGVVETGCTGAACVAQVTLKSLGNTPTSGSGNNLTSTGGTIAITGPSTGSNIEVLDLPNSTPCTSTPCNVPATFTAGVGGTTVNNLVQLDTSAPTKVIPASTGAFGIALASVSASASVNVARNGSANCATDNNVTAGHLLIQGTSTVTFCKDSGQTSSALIPFGTPIIGIARSSATAPATTLVELTPEKRGTGVGFSTLVDGATITWTLGTNQSVANAKVVLGGNRTLQIAGLIDGGSYVLKVIQDATGSRGLTLGTTGCTWAVLGGGGTAITPSTAANAVDVLAFTYDAGAGLCSANFNKQ